MKLSEDVVPLAELKINPGRIISRVTETRAPILLTRRGRRVAVVQAAEDYNRAEEERRFMRAVVAGLSGLESSEELSLDEARRQLNLD